MGLDLFLGADISVPETLVQIPGNAQHMASSDFRAALDRMPALRSIVGHCIHAFVTQVSQTAACNRLHGVEQRCARWLLLTHDRVAGAESFPLTHQFLSFMLGVRRAGVTEALGALTSAGLIRSKAGQITVMDRDGLEGGMLRMLRDRATAFGGAVRKRVLMCNWYVFVHLPPRIAM